MKRQFRFSKKLIDALPPHPRESKSRESEYSDTEVAGLRILVNRLGRKFFYFRYSFQNAKRSMKLGDYPALEITDARLKAIECRTQLAKGVDPQKAKTPQVAQQPITFQEFALEEYLPHSKATKRSWEDDECRLRVHLIPAFGKLALNEITSYAIQQLHDAVKIKRRPATANRLLSLIKRILNVAILWDKLEKNPAKGIRMHHEDNQRQRYLSPQELRTFWGELSAYENQDVADVFRFLLSTGVRKEECLGLTWDCVDIDAKQIYLPKSKTGSRFVVLNDSAIAVLNRRVEIKGIPNVFCRRWVTKESDTWRPICSVAKPFKKILARCSISNFRIHDLRHSFASMAINNGASLFEIKSLLGHADVKTSARYSHISPTRLREASGHVATVISKSQERQSANLIRE